MISRAPSRRYKIRQEQYLLFLGAAASALVAAVPFAAATTFSYTGNIQTYTVPTTGAYVLSAAGAQGGSFDYRPKSNPGFVNPGARARW